MEAQREGQTKLFREIDTAAALAPHLPREAVSRMLRMFRADIDPWSRAQALAAPAPSLSGRKRAGLLAEALAAARAVDDPESRVQVLAPVISRLPPERRSTIEAEALAAVRTIHSEGGRAQALEMLAPHLCEHTVVEAIPTAEALRVPVRRADTLKALGIRLTGQQRSHVLAETLAATLAMEEGDSRARRLAYLAPHLSAAQLKDMLSAATAGRPTAPT